MLYLFGAKIRLFLVTSKVLGKKYLKRMGRKKKIGGSRNSRVAYDYAVFIMMKQMLTLLCSRCCQMSFL